MTVNITYKNVRGRVCRSDPFWLLELATHEGGRDDADSSRNGGADADTCGNADTRARDCSQGSSEDTRKVGRETGQEGGSADERHRAGEFQGQIHHQ